MGRFLTIRDVGRLFGLDLPTPPGRSKCPLRKHARDDKTFRVYQSSTSQDELYKCWSCDAPENMGDAVMLYAELAHMDRKEAWKFLADQGYDVGQEVRPGGQGGATQRPAPRPPRPATPPLQGTRKGPVMPLDQDAWALWQKLDTGLLEAFGKRRGLTAEFLRSRDVIELPGGRHIGFTYRDPATGLPCRVKVRGVDKKTFFVVPRAPESDPGRRAYAPLYLGHLLAPPMDRGLKPVIITEGEIDALSLVEKGFPNVVSLPDGSESVKTADVDLLWSSAFNVWLLCLDADEAGDRAYKILRARAEAAGVDAVRVFWRKLVSAESGEEIVTYKDANEALLAGFTQDDFVQSFNVATEPRYGSPIPWELAA